MTADGASPSQPASQPASQLREQKRKQKQRVNAADKCESIEWNTHFYICM